MNTLFVSTTAGTTQNGSAANPFATLGQAIAAVPYGQGANYTIEMGQGTYANTGSLALGFGDNGLTIDGTLSILSAASAVKTILTISNAYNVTINGLTFENEAPGVLGSNAAVAILGGGNNTLTSDGFKNDYIGLLEEGSGDVIGGPTAGDGDLFRNITNTAIDVPATTNLLIQKLYIDGGGTGIEIDDGAGITITQADITNVGGDGVLVNENPPTNSNYPNNLTIADSVFTNIGTAGGVYGDFCVIGAGTNPGWGTLDFINNSVTQNSANDRAVILSNAVGAVITGNTFDIANGATSWLLETGSSLDVTSPNTIIG